MDKKTSTLVNLNISTLLIAFSALYSKLLPIPPSLIICGRSFFASVSLGFYLVIRKKSIRLFSKKIWILMIICGVLLGIHWTTYYQSIQVSSVAIGIISLYTFPVITGFLEPLFFKSKLNFHDIISAFLVLAGLAIITPFKTLDQNVLSGVFFGLISALTYSVRNLISKKYFTGLSGSVSMFYQVLISFLMLLPFTGLFTFGLSIYQWVQLFILGTVLSAIAHTLFLNTFKTMSVAQASVISGLQPVYAIILAYFILDEIPGWKTLLGGSLILISVYIEAMRFYKAK